MIWRMVLRILCVLGLGGLGLAHAAAIAYLPVDQAFRLSASFHTPQEVVLRWDIAPGYHLYKDRITIQVPQSAPVSIQKVVFSSPAVMQNTAIGQFEVFEHVAEVQVFLSHPQNPLTLQVNYQGCLGTTFCYPPVQQRVLVTERGLPIDRIPSNFFARAMLHPVSNHGIAHDYRAWFSHHHAGWVIGGFFVVGLLLALTPCVFPMLPILASIIAGQKKLVWRTAFSLSLCYVLSFSMIFAVAGIFTAWAGNSVQAFLQNPWLLGITGLLFLLLALSLFGLYHLQLPHKWQKRLEHVMQRQTMGTYIGVCVLGALSSLVVSPCVSAPLVGALLYISQTGNMGLGGAALFALGLGMGAPLLIVGTVGGRYLMKAGSWMHTVKVFLGILMVGMAVWMFARALPEHVWRFEKTEVVATVQTTPQLTALLQEARRKHRPVLLDFTATWCLTCKELDYTTFRNDAVRNLMNQVVWIRVDVTQQTPETAALQKAWHVFAPPTLIFITAEGKMSEDWRIYGYIAP